MTATRPTAAHSETTPREPGVVPFERAAARVLGNLQRALSELVAVGAPGARKAADVERAFGVDPRLGWQVYRLATAENPLAHGTNIPARVSIRRLCAAAAKRKVSSDVIERASEAFDDFERLQQEYAEDRDELDTMISALAPEAREKHEQATHQAAFKAMGQIKGLVMASWTGTWMFSPAADDQLVDHVFLLGNFGLRRLRPSASIVLGTGSTAAAARTLTIDGGPSDGPTGTLLTEFCTTPLPHFQTRSADGMRYCRVVDEDIGLRTAADIVLADFRPASSRRYREAGGRTMSGGAIVIDIPAKRLTMDVFVHHALFRGAAPQVHVYDTAARGFVQAPGDPTREHDRLDHSEAVRPIVGGIAGSRLAHVPRYLDMLSRVCEKRGWNPDDFRGYRLDAHFPVYGANYMLALDLPEPP